MLAIVELLKTSDLLVFAAPVYYGGIPSKLKAVIDRFYVLGAKKMTIRQCILLTVAGRNTESATDSIIHYYRYLADFMKWDNWGEVEAIGYEKLAAIADSEELKKVREFVKQLSPSKCS
jgi:Multimeric flavodoxin WrbA